jgi:transposase InsO family protein
MNGRTLTLCPGARLFYQGDLVEVTELAGTTVVLRNDRTSQFTSVRISRLVAAAHPASTAPTAGNELFSAVTWHGLSDAERGVLTDRARHVREVLTGYRAGHPGGALAGEPRRQYDASQPLRARYRAKAKELQVDARTIERWVKAYRQAGEAGLVDNRTVRGRGSTVDPRWDEAVRLVLADLVSGSTPTRNAVLRMVDGRLDQIHGEGVVPRPSSATAYRRLAELTKGTNAVAGSAKGRRSIANRPKGTYGRLRAVRPGQYAVLDTQDLDVFAVEPVTCRWLGAQLTVAQDLFTRCICGLRVTPVSTKAVDVAGVLYQSMVPQPVPEGWPEQACWPYHGVPQHLVFTEDGRLPGVPVCPPETLVVDHGKAFLSAHVISVCTQLGISIQPAQPNKPTVERFFRTLREGLIQYLPAYKGPDIYSRGEKVEDQAFFFLHELEDLIREWVALVYHRTPHDGLTVPEWPHLKLSPNEMYEIGVARAGLLRIPATPELAYEFFEVHPRTIQHYGVEIDGLHYNGDALQRYGDAESPYGGEYAGRWPIRINPDDVRYAYFQDPADDSWHRLDWEHAAGLGAAFSGEAAHLRTPACRPPGPLAQPGGGPG